MQKINLKGIIWGGLLAGLIINAGEFLLNVVILGTEWDAVMQSLNRPVVGDASIALLNAMSFVFGIIMVWVYSLIRSGLIPDKKAALYAGLAAWAFAYGIGFGWSYVMTVFTSQVYFTTLIWSLFEISIASQAGAWVYRKSA